MGQAKKKAAARQEQSELIKSFDFSRVATAVRRLATAASSHVGSDCFIHADLAREILTRQGIKADLVVGFAAWRLSDDDDSVVVHAPLSGMKEQDGVPYHVWLEVGGMIFDVTSYQLRQKARALDALDGGHTEVDWCPDFLLEKKQDSKSLRETAKGRVGDFYYERNVVLEKKIMETSQAADPGDIETVLLLFNNPGVIVFGPNDMID
ncbi:lasso peptide biosynthesis protein (plasmid) [Trichlorobacter lovleyi]|uniref:lasso peptide biosynthesis protein n=1 Tax=Trichlorobacter lovleyi TaxID=313985 RepID=UPI00224088C0|nr:lasso peptide biosynthesis protein [Trichlorobacter lovleyi]QOX80888.1 lasso peptide biosynthesis protein [Trichlorobacter lovleyi]